MVSVNETARSESGVINITTSSMRRLFMRFPEVTLIDATHKTNRYDQNISSLSPCLNRSIPDY